MLFIVASRPDLFGGKLITLLNGLRLAGKLGLRFLYTWEIQRPDVLAPPTTYFDDAFAAPYAPGGGGFVIDPSALAAMRSTAEIEIVETNGRETTAVRLDPSVLAGVDAFVCSERFAFYLLPGESPAEVRAEIAALAAAFPLNPAVRDAALLARRHVGAAARRMRSRWISTRFLGSAGAVALRPHLCRAQSLFDRRVADRQLPFGRCAAGGRCRRAPARHRQPDREFLFSIAPLRQRQ